MNEEFRAKESKGAKEATVDMNEIKRMTMTGMIEMDLQQAWACLGAQKFELARGHLEEAARKVDQLANIAAEETQPTQIDLIAEEKHETTQLILEV